MARRVGAFRRPAALFVGFPRLTERRRRSVTGVDGADINSPAAVLSPCALVTMTWAGVEPHRSGQFRLIRLRVSSRRWSPRHRRHPYD